YAPTAAARRKTRKEARESSQGIRVLNLNLMSVLPQKRLCLLALLLSLSSLAAAAQVKPPATAPHEKVLFSSDKPPAPPAMKTAKSIDTVTDAERSSLTFTAYDL